MPAEGVDAEADQTLTTTVSKIQLAGNVMLFKKSLNVRSGAKISVLKRVRFDTAIRKE